MVFILTQFARKFTLYIIVSIKMEPDADIKITVSEKGPIIKYIGFSVVIFAFGFFASAAWRGGSDAINKATNIAKQTAGDVFAPQEQAKGTISIPIKGSGSTSKKIASANNAPTASTAFSPVFIAPPVVQGAVITSSLPVATTTASSTILAQSPTSTSAVTSEQSAQVASAPTQTQVPAPVVEPQPVSAPASQPQATQNILFYEIQISGGQGFSERDFIRIYNPNSFAVDVSGWKLRKKSKTGTDSSIKVIPDGTSLASGGTLIWANSKDGFSATVGAQISSTATISPDNSIALLNANGTIMDAVAWGEGASQYIEGSPHQTNPDGGQIVRSKTQGSILQDTHNNSADFGI